MTVNISTVRRGFIALAAGAVAVAVTAAPALAGTAHPAAQPTGRESFTIGGDTDHPIVIMHGAITAAGQDDPNHDNYDVLKFAHGSFRVVHPQAAAKYVSHVDKKTCFATFTESGQFTLEHGTGRYAGIKGSGSYTANGTGLLARTKSGACDENAKPVAEIFTVHAHGSLK
jgi:hypothetical protein